MGKKIRYFILIIFLVFLGNFLIKREYRHLAKLNENIRPIIWIYGKFWTLDLLPRLENTQCNNFSKWNVIRTYEYIEHDIVVVHFMEYNTFLEKFKHINHGKKIMIIYLMEPPFYVNKPFFTFVKTEKYFVWISSYMRSSYVRSTYFRFRKVNNHLDQNIILREFNSRKNAALILVSNCNLTFSIRVEYVLKLNQHYPVVTYGTCFSNPLTPETHYDLIKQYKFFISFENSLCMDYATEKYSNAILNGAIPVIMAHSLVVDSYIPQSYINAFDFKNPKELADYLWLVSNNFPHYAKHFEWKKNFQMCPARIYTDYCSILKKYWAQNNMYSKDDPTITMLGDLNFCVLAKEQKTKLIKE